MSKKYKIWMFVLAGIGVFLIIGGIANIKDNIGAAIFGIVAGLVVGIPMLALYPYLEKKRKEELKRKKKAAKKKAEEEKKRAEEEAKAKAAEEAKYFQLFYDVECGKKAASYLKNEDERVSVTLKPFKRGDELVYAVIFNGEEKVGEIVEDEAIEIRETVEKAKLVYIGVDDYEADVIPETGERYYNVTLRLKWKKREQA